MYDALQRQENYTKYLIEAKELDEWIVANKDFVSECEREWDAFSYCAGQTIDKRSFLAVIKNLKNKL